MKRIKNTGFLDIKINLHVGCVLNKRKGILKRCAVIICYNYIVAHNKRFIGALANIKFNNLSIILNSRFDCL